MSASVRRFSGLFVVGIVVLAGLAAMSGTAAAGSPTCSDVTYNGSGTDADPYQVENVSQLQCIADRHDGPGLDKHYTLTSNIDASGTNSWNGGDGFEPIGSNSYEFTGTFDGNGHTITGLTINRPSETLVGLFAEGDGSEITSVALEDVSVTGDYHVGGLIGRNKGTVISSYTTGTVTSNTEDGGGLVGYNLEGTVKRSYSTANVSGSEDVGGLVGYNYDGTVRSAYATGNVSGDSDVGGLVGSNYGTVTDSYWNLNTTTQSTSAGGTGLTTSQMKGDSTGTTMAGFNFSTNWNVFENASHHSYPYLRTNTETPAPGFERKQYVDGSGTESDPYEIATWHQLNNTRDNLGANFTLVADLNDSTQGYDEVASSTASGGKGFVPIGNGSSAFTGTFDGDNQTIAGLYINRSRESADGSGLFGRSGPGAVIENVSLADADVNNPDIEENIGGLVGYNEGTVNETSVSGNVSGTVSGTYHVGGVVGQNTGSVDDSSASANVSGTERVGGLVGFNTGTVNSSDATGNVSGQDDVGGLVGENDGGAVHSTYATGNVTGSSSNVGGLVGWNREGTIKQSYAIGDVSANVGQVGGLVGQNTGTIDSSYASGNVSGDKDVGGLVGYDYQGTITSSYATGTVTGNSSVGGVIGITYGGTVVINSYWDIETTNQSTSDGGTGLTTAEMTGGAAVEYMDGLDFDNTWTTVDGENVSYPSLLNNTQQPAPGLQAALFADGVGTDTDPWHIADWTHLDNVGDTPGANFTLVNDLNESTTGYDEVANATANGGKGFEPIGSDTATFNGTFDGSNHTITGLYIDRSRDSADGTGLFGRTGSGALIQNLSLADADVNNSGIYLNVGGLVGRNSGTVKGSSVEGNISGWNDIGGLVGDNDGGTVKFSNTTANVYGSGQVGGLVGFNRGTVNSSHADGNLSSPNANQLGGLVGSNDGTVKLSSVTGNVSGNSQVGGLVGSNTGTVASSNATGTVSGDGSTIGGLVGYNDGTVEDSYATGSVSSSGIHVGGLVGNNVGTVQRSYATGSVSSSTDHVGGLIGYDLGTVAQAYATGNVSGDSEVGGLIGWKDGGTVSDGYWDVNTTNQSDGIGLGSGTVTGLTTSEMKGDSTETTMSPFDFPTTWGVLDNASHQSYPYLQATTQTPAPGLERKQYAGGSGNQTDPYRIANWYQLDNTRDNLDANFTLVAELNASTDGYDEVANGSANGDKGFDPIGDDSTAFTGTFDGGKYTIHNLTIDRTDPLDVGLFGINDGTITNVSLGDATVTGGKSGTTNGYHIGTVVGQNEGLVSKSWATGTVTGTGGYSSAGGISGYNVGTVIDSYAIVNVTGENNAGGLIGNVGIGNEVNRTYAAGDVTGGDLSTGGIVGSGTSGSVTHSYWDINTTGEAYTSGDRVGLTTHQLKGNDSLTGFDYGNIWTVLDATDTVSYPYLQNNPQTPAPGRTSVAVLDIGAFGDQFSDSTGAKNYSVAEIPIEETNNVSTDSLTVTLTVTDSSGNTVFEKTNASLTLRNETATVGFAVGEIATTDDYTARVTAKGAFAAERTVTESFTISSSSSGGAGGGGGGSRVDEATEEQPGALSAAASALAETEPTREAEVDIQDATPDEPGVTVETGDAGSSVGQVTFDDETTSRSVTITEYSDPPSAVTDSISQALAGDGDDIESMDEGTEPDSGATGDGTDGDSDSDDGSDSSSITVLSVADISSQNDDGTANDNTGATVTMRVDADDVTNPSNVVILHETADGWEQLETSVEETNDGIIRFTARTESFSLFAVAEVMTAESTESTETATDDDQSDDPTVDTPSQPTGDEQGPDDASQSMPGDEEDGTGETGSRLGLVFAVLVVIATLAVGVWFRQRDGNGN